MIVPAWDAESYSCYDLAYCYMEALVTKKKTLLHDPSRLSLAVIKSWTIYVDRCRCLGVIPSALNDTGLGLLHGQDTWAVCALV